VTVKRYPPGPTPLPWIGNLILFVRGIGTKHPHEIIQEIARDYGPVITLWFGPLPFVFAIHPQAVMQALKSKSFAGRPHVGFINEIIMKPNSISILPGNPSRGVLKRVTHGSHTNSRLSSSSISSYPCH